MRLARAACGAIVFTLAVTGGAHAQQPQPPDCSAAEHRQFDFWVGTWDVSLPNGNRAGENRISLILKDCVLLEEWTGAGGMSGKSYNIWDRTRQVWHQTWVSDAGALLQLEGKLVDGAMVLEGNTLGANGATIMNRVTWSQVGTSPDRVRQYWQQSSDGGATWSAAFDGLYTKRGG